MHNLRHIILSMEVLMLARTVPEPMKCSVASLTVLRHIQLRFF